MKNFDDYKKLLMELSGRANDAAGSDSYSSISKDILSTPELEYRKERVEDFLLRNKFEDDGTYEEAKAYIDGIDSFLKRRK